MTELNDLERQLERIANALEALVPLLKEIGDQLDRQPQQATAIRIADSLELITSVDGDLNPLPSIAGSIAGALQVLAQEASDAGEARRRAQDKAQQLRNYGPPR